MNEEVKMEESDETKRCAACDAEVGKEDDCCDEFCTALAFKW